MGTQTETLRLVNLPRFWYAVLRQLKNSSDGLPKGGLDEVVRKNLTDPEMRGKILAFPDLEWVHGAETESQKVYLQEETEELLNGLARQTRRDKNHFLKASIFFLLKEEFGENFKCKFAHPEQPPIKIGSFLSKHWKDALDRELTEANSRLKLTNEFQVNLATRTLVDGIILNALKNPAVLEQILRMPKIEAEIPTQLGNDIRISALTYTKLHKAADKFERSEDHFIKAAISLYLQDKHGADFAPQFVPAVL